MLCLGYWSVHIQFIRHQWIKQTFTRLHHIYRCLNFCKIDFHLINDILRPFHANSIRNIHFSKATHVNFLVRKRTLRSFSHLRIKIKWQWASSTNDFPTFIWEIPIEFWDCCSISLDSEYQSFSREIERSIEFQETIIGHIM